jgi:hypothetical protein
MFVPQPSSETHWREAASGTRPFDARQLPARDRPRMNPWLAQTTGTRPVARSDHLTARRQVLRPSAAATVPYASGLTTDCGRR